MPMIVEPHEPVVLDETDDHAEPFGAALWFAEQVELDFDRRHRALDHSEPGYFPPPLPMSTRTRRA